jgi:hypothetical protein
VPAGTQQLTIQSLWGTNSAPNPPTSGAINFNILELPNLPLS